MILEQTVAQVIKSKGSREVYIIDPSASVYDALCIMARQNAGALVVMNGDTILGMVSERDYARKVLLAGRTSRTTEVREIMSRQVLYVTDQDPIEGVLTLMTEKRVRHVPVLTDGKLSGLISIGDVVKAVISDQRFMIDQLVKYVTGFDHGWYDRELDGRIEERFAGDSSLEDETPLH